MWNPGARLGAQSREEGSPEPARAKTIHRREVTNRMSQAITASVGDVVGGYLLQDLESDKIRKKKTTKKRPGEKKRKEKGKKGKKKRKRTQNAQPRAEYEQQYLDAGQAQGRSQLGLERPGNHR